ncbi:hypothetical protein PIB30_086995 [Stylosanthes scabra]|uniref:Uncharacterized protein n=1 Tax=Stylosanthes scabra TaxID=79078 RepID=A0ABU6TVL5_9FABA|nr:hypothetical protein [Stylosanthes scabra]
MAMKKESSVIHAQQIMMLLIIYYCWNCYFFVIAESHEIVPNNNNKESWTPSYYYYYYSKDLGTPSYYITSIDPNRKIGKLRKCLHNCIEKFWPRHGKDLTPPRMVKHCTDNCIRDFDNPFT